MENSWRFPAEILFLTGFLVGNIIPNLIWKMEWKQKTLASFYLIRNFAGKDISGGAYLLEVLRHRGVLFLFLFFCGFTIFGVPLSVAYMLILGMETGLILTLSVLEFGIYGGVAGAGLLIPQYVIYIPVYFYLAGLVYRQSYDIWKNYGLVPQKSRLYIRQGMTAFLVYTGGILAESFLNPWILEKVVKGLKFFKKFLQYVVMVSIKSAIFGGLRRNVLKLRGFALKNRLILCKIHSIIQS